MHYLNMNFYDNKKIVFEPSFDTMVLTFIQGMKLNDLILNIKLSDDEDIYYEGELENEDVNSKFEKLIAKGGWIHFTNGTSYKIRKSRIVCVKLYRDSLAGLDKIDIKKVVELIGKPSKVEENKYADYFGIDDDGDIYHYKNRGIAFQFDPETDKITEVRIT